MSIFVGPVPAGQCASAKEYTQYRRMTRAWILSESKKRAVLTTENARLAAELELERMRLAGCGVAARGNTDKDVDTRLTREHPYWSASYDDVCQAVDRERMWRDKFKASDNAAFAIFGDIDDALSGV